MTDPVAAGGLVPAIEGLAWVAAPQPAGVSPVWPARD
jgi:hypothetical protein